MPHLPVPLAPPPTLRGVRLPRRLSQLAVGLTLYGASVALLVRAGLGTMPWSVLEVGITRHVHLSLGTVIVVMSFVVLLLWIPLRQRPGVGTVANSLWVGPAAGITLAMLPPTPASWSGQALMAACGIGLNAFAGALYIGSRLGAGPRDGLMTGLHARTGWSLRLVRTGIEVSVLAVGIALGGVFGLGTVVYALTIGPSTQFLLRRFTVRPVPEPATSVESAPPQVLPTPDALRRMSPQAE
ncbi:YczE/YyaS/YitT family protein [Dermacoccaceae bacterium W4C1]